MVMILYSCKVQVVEKELICGTFYRLEKGKDFDFARTLDLKSDNTFELIINTSEGRPQCKGKWEMINNKFILLKCNDDNNPYETISNIYMSQKEHKVQILGKNRLKYDDVILRRKKN